MPQIQPIQFFVHPSLLLARTKDGPGHHRSQRPLLQPRSGLAIPLPNPDIFDALRANLFAGTAAASAQALTDAKPVGGG